jgi:hypothetical protein
VEAPSRSICRSSVRALVHDRLGLTVHSRTKPLRPLRAVAFVSGFVKNLDLAWEYPPYTRFLRRLASFSRLILMDRRGSGLSDRFSPRDLPPLEVL